MLNDSSSAPQENNRRGSPAESKRRNFSVGKLIHGISTMFSGAALYLVPPVVASLTLVPLYLLGGYAGFFDVAAFEGTPAEQFVFVLLTEIFAILLLMVFLKSSRETWRTIAVRIWGTKVLRYTVFGFVLYYVLYIATMMVADMFLPLDLDQRQELGFETTITGLALFFPLFSLVVLPPIVEEIIFRGWLYTRFRRIASKLIAALLVSVLFAAAHLQFGSGNALLWVAAIDTFILSMVLVWLREKTGAIWAGVGLHALKNSVAFYVLFIHKLL